MDDFFPIYESFVSSVWGLKVDARSLFCDSDNQKLVIERWNEKTTHSEILKTIRSLPVSQKILQNWKTRLLSLRKQTDRR